MASLNKHGCIGSRWVTVPNHFPDSEDLSSEAWYHLVEGYCVGEYETKSSGKYYKKVRTMYCDSVDSLLYYLGYSNWQTKWKIRRNPFSRFFIGSWMAKDQ